RGDGNANLQRAAGTGLIAKLLKTRTTHIGEIGRHERQHAGAEKAENTGPNDERKRKFHLDAPWLRLGVAGLPRKAMSPTATSNGFERSSATLMSRQVDGRHTQISNHP